MRAKNLLALVVLAIALLSCDDHKDRHGDWAKAAQFSGENRTGAVSFVLNKDGGEIAYVGLGVGDKSNEFKNFKKYNYKTNTWTNVDNDFIGDGRHSAVAFVIGNNAYVGTGYRSAKSSAESYQYFKDFYKFDGTTETWTKIENFPGEARRDAVAFSIEGTDGKTYGYVGTGYGENGNLYKDFYCFDPETETWSKEDIGYTGSAVYGATAFVIDGNAYVCMGAMSSISMSRENNRFTPGSGGKGTWKPMQSLTNKPGNRQDKDYDRIPRWGGISFISNRGKDHPQAWAYVANGLSSGANGQYTWRYNHLRDTWHECEKLPPSASILVNAVSFAVNGYGFYTTGGGNWDSTSGMSDSWLFVPDVKETRINDDSPVDPNNLEQYYW